MKKYFGITLVALMYMALTACDKSDHYSSLVCQDISLGMPFNAHIGESYCIPGTDFKMTLGDYFDDGRCNVSGIECFWEGEYVMEVTFEGTAVTQDTFHAIHLWRDTLSFGTHTIELNTVYPLSRSSFDPLDPGAYRFEMIVR